MFPAAGAVTTACAAQARLDRPVLPGLLETVGSAAAHHHDATVHVWTKGAPCSGEIWTTADVHALSRSVCEHRGIIL